MFGYIRPVREELRLRDFDRYHAVYCGVCRTLGKRFGFAARFLVNYDMTFLYLLLSSVAPAAEAKRRSCPARFGCKKPCVEDAKIMEYVAAIDVILCRYKLEDDIADNGFFGAIPARLARLLTARAYRRAARLCPAVDKQTGEGLKSLRTLEEAKCASLDETADCFASILSDCADFYQAPELRRPMEQVLYHVGRFLYLTDAWDDLAQDCRKDDYNPLRYRFSVTNGKLNDEQKTYFRELLDGSIRLAGTAFELLPHRCNAEILENILYLGLPAVRSAVEHGSFHAADRKGFARITKGETDERSL